MVSLSWTLFSNNVHPLIVYLIDGISSMVLLHVQNHRTSRHGVFHPEEKGQPSYFSPHVSPHHHAYLCMDRGQMAAGRSWNFARYEHLCCFEERLGRSVCKYWNALCIWVQFCKGFRKITQDWFGRRCYYTSCKAAPLAERCPDSHISSKKLVPSLGTHCDDWWLMTYNILSVDLTNVWMAWLQLERGGS